VTPGLTWEIAHLGFVVDRLEPWMETYGKLFPGRWTSQLTIDAEFLGPKAGVPCRAEGRSVVRVGPLPPVELIEGKPGSPWYLRGGHSLHHIGYWASTFPEHAQALIEAGYQLEYTFAATPSVDSATFAYFVHADGPRIELHADVLKPAITRWWRGGELDMSDLA
jgi:hypothetical protein